ncbi:MAG TPA: hypothetical protein VKA08_18175 [Balneolales bacterium]|nr:hypothetical protein [Balneolales bacterium]
METTLRSKKSGYCQEIAMDETAKVPVVTNSRSDVQLSRQEVLNLSNTSGRKRETTSPHTN